MLRFTARTSSPTSLLPVLLVLLLATDLWAAPLTKYDQRQEGELNVHAHLENFVILLIPSSGGLFNFAAKVAPAKHHGKHGGGSKGPVVQGSVKQDAPAAPTVTGAAVVPVGVKAAPYKVDIDADRRLPIVLEITAPHVRDEVPHEIVIAQSPIVALRTAPKDMDKEEAAMEEEKKEEAMKDEEKKEEEKKDDEKTEEAETMADKKEEEKKEDAVKDEKKEEAPMKEEEPAKEAQKPSEAQPEKPKKEAAAAAPAAEPAAQEAKSRAARLEVLSRGLEPSPGAPCGADERRGVDGRCLPAGYAPARISKSFEDRELLKALRFGLAPASN